MRVGSARDAEEITTSPIAPPAAVGENAMYTLHDCAGVRSIGPAPQELLPCCSENGPVIVIDDSVIGLAPESVITACVVADITPTGDCIDSAAGLTEIAY